jgi:hypothetical protein
MSGAHTTAAGGAAAAGAMSDYELQRLEHIRRNNEYLVQLGLALPSNIAGAGTASAAATVAMTLLSPAAGAAADAAGPARRPRAKLKLAPTRRSNRVAGAAPQYTGEFIDTFFDGEG